MPLPISATGSRRFWVYGRATAGPGQTCAAFVLGANGAIVRWKEITLQIAETWHGFESQAVNENESAVVECNLLQAGEVWVGAVKGWGVGF
jgi:hypothetical protein